MINSTSIDAMVIILGPIIVALIAVYFTYRSKHTAKSTKKYMLLAMGFVVLAVFFVIVPDPEFIQVMFLEQGNYTTPLIFSVVAAVVLYFCIVIFRKHEES
jgi:drug/metabolite transporter (DMT)-like permease